MAGAAFEELWSRGWSCYLREEYAEAIACFREATAIDPESHAAHYALASALSDDGEMEEAELEFRRTLALRDFSLAWAGLALLYLRAGKIELAEQTHLEAMRLRPYSRERVEAYADYLWDVGREEESRVQSMRATQLNPDSRRDVQ